MYFICPFRVSLIDTFRCNRNIKRRAWRIPEVCHYIYEKYGKVVSLRLFGQIVLIVTDYERASSLMTNHGPSLKQRFGNQFGLSNINMYLTGLIWNNNVEQWKSNRNIFESSLKMGVKNLEDLALCHLETVEKTSLKIAEPDTLLEILRNFTLSMTMEGLFEIPIDYTTRPDQWLEETKRTVADYFKAWEFFLLNAHCHNLAEIELHKNACSKMLQLSQEIFAQSEQIGTSTFISHLADFNDKNGILQCIAEMLLAGTDTSSITMFYTLLFLADHPEIADNLSKKIRSESQETIDKEISYLYYESMRLIPVGPVILRQCETDIEEGKYILRKGDGIIFNIAGINREHYSQPQHFNPYRYKTENFPLSFGVGKKSCVGKTFAEKEMKIFFTWFLKKYTALGHREEIVGSLETRWDVANTPVNDIKLTIFPRKIIYFVGEHKTGKTRTLNAIKAAYPKIRIISKEEILMGQQIEDLDQEDDIKFCDSQQYLIEAHSKLLSKLQSELVFIEGSMVECIVNLKGRDVNHNNNETELLRSMTNCLFVYFPISSPGKSQKNEDFLDILKRMGGRYHYLIKSSESERYSEIMDFIAECSRD